MFIKYIIYINIHIQEYTYSTCSDRDKEKEMLQTFSTCSTRRKESLMWCFLVKKDQKICFSVGHWWETDATGRRQVVEAIFLLE